MLKLLHTSDWHLGKKLFKLDRLPEQELFLDWLLGRVREHGVHHLLVAGDVFDVPQPPHKALRLFYDFLSRLVTETDCQAWIIGGNHDSGALLEAPSALVDSGRVHLHGQLREDPAQQWVKLPFPGGGGHLDLCLLPYFRHHELSPWRGRWESDLAREDWPEQLVRQFLAAPPAEKAAGRIFMGHHLFGLFEAAGSEQALALSGLESVPLDWLATFDYAALGHIHKPQRLREKNPMVWYSGSPLPLRFSETAPKQVNLLEWESSGVWRCSPLPLPAWRPLPRLKAQEGDWQAVLDGVSLEAPLAPAVELELMLDAPVPGLLEKIRAHADARGFAELLLLPSFRGDGAKEEAKDWTALLELDPLELFDSFYKAKYPAEAQVPADLREDVKALLEEVRHAPPPA